MKDILSKIRIVAIAAFGYVLLKALYSTWRWELAAPRTRSELLALPLKRIFAFWHGHQLLCPSFHREFFPNSSARVVHTLISEHSDGRIIALTTRFLGFSNVPGSSTRGGTRALIRLAQVLKQGQDVAITPDGPRGPLHEVKPGTIALAKLTGAPVLLLGLAADRFWQFRSWDKMILPKPFARVVVAVGGPFTVSPDSKGDEHERLRLQEELRAVNARASAHFGASA